MMEVTLFPVGVHGTNCWLLAAGGDACLIDPDGVSEKMTGFLAENKLRLRYILLTHGHFDHVGGVAELKKLYPDAAVYIGEADARAAHVFFPLRAEEVGALFYGEGDTLPLGGESIRVLATPGHTAGGVTLDTGDLLFTGDTLFCRSCGRTDLYGGSAESLKKSLRRLRDLAGDRKVFPGHGEATTLAEERLHNPYLA